MVPFTIPQDGELVNLSQIVRICDLNEGSIAVHFTNGKIITYEGQAAAIIKGGAVMNRQIYESWAMQILNPSNIVTPDGSGRMM